MIKSFIQSQVPESRAPESRTDSSAELQQLRQRIAELEASIETPKRAKAPTRRRSRKN
jgi:hypothetical protein